MYAIFIIKYKNMEILKQLYTYHTQNKIDIRKSVINVTRCLNPMWDEEWRRKS